MNKGLKTYVLVLTAFFLCAAGAARAFAENGQESPMGKTADFLFRPVQSLFTGAKNKAAEWVDSIASAGAYRAENEQLKEELARLKKEEREISSLKKENERLRALLQLKEENSRQHTVSCSVIAEDASGISGVFQIDKGKAFGIERDDTVITYNGLVGRVTAVYENSASVMPITRSGSGVGARIVRNQGLGVAQSDADKLLLSSFSEEAMPVRGDEVETSGMGGIYPAGILIGTVSEITARETVITPAVNLRELREVLVIRKDG